MLQHVLAFILSHLQTAHNFLMCAAYKSTNLAEVLHYFIIIGIQPLGQPGQRPEFSQATGMALVHCIVGKFLGVVCQCFHPNAYYSNYLPD